MTHIIPAREIDYDFELRYNSIPRFKIGDLIPRGVRDDDGQIVHFNGTAVVVFTEHSAENARGSEFRILGKTSPLCDIDWWVHDAKRFPFF